MPVDEDTSPSPAQHSSIDLQLCVLRNLPVPVLVLSPKCKAVFANKTAAKLLGQVDPIQSASHKILGSSPLDLGVHLLYNRKWDVVLRRLLEAQTRASEEGEVENVIHELDVLVDSQHLSYEERRFRILATIVTADDGAHYVLSFERGVHTPEKFIPESEGTVQSNPRPVEHAVGDEPVQGLRDIPRIKKAVFDSCNVVGFILTADEKFYLTNKRWREVLGDAMGDDEDMDGYSLRSQFNIWDETFSRRLQPEEFPGLRLVRARHPFTNYRCGFIHTVTGDKTVVSVDGECLYDDDTGEFLGGICWCYDLQEYSEFLTAQMQNRLQSHEMICDLMPHLVWTTLSDGTCDYFSQRWYDFTGMSREDSLGIGWQKAVHPEDLAVLWDKWNTSVDLGEECEIEVRYRRHDGVFKWTLVRACPFCSDSGETLKWYGTITDIHDLVMARIEAARNKLQMLTVLSHAEVNIFSIDKDRKILMAEGGMLWQSHGATITNKSFLIGQDAIVAAQNTQKGGIPAYEKNVLEILAGRVGMASSEDRIGDRMYRTRLVAELEHDTVDGGQKPTVIGVLGLTIDVTDMKARQHLEVDNTRLVMEEQAAKDSNRLKSQFLANMSHEMRTPTAGVIGMVELLAEDPTLSVEQREYVDSIQLSAKALLTIVNDILDFSKIESGRLDIEEVPFNMASVVGELCKLLSLFAQRKGLNFVYEDSMDESLELLGDPGRIRQVLSNLLTNALKFTVEGSVSISVSSTAIPSQLAGEDTIQVEFIIEDTGVGIEPHVLEKLFRPFRQGDSSTARLFGGTGLGLTISKNLATLMRGSISLESTPSVGSKAIFKIPLKVASYCLNPASMSSSPPNLGFKLYPPAPSSNKWGKQLAQRPVNQRLLNQQISSSVTTAGYTPPPPHSLRRASLIDNMTMGQNVDRMTAEQRAKCHILVVEDNAINQTIAVKTVQKLGFPVTAVWNGREALSYLLSPSEVQPRPNVILMDVQMPVLDGYEATRILRTGAEYAKGEGNASGDSTGESKSYSKTGLLKNIPVIAMTASAIQGDREKCHAAGMDDYLAKPVEKERLEAMLVKWGRKTMSE